MGTNQRVINIRALRQIMLRQKVSYRMPIVSILLSSLRSSKKNYLYWWSPFPFSLPLSLIGHESRRFFCDECLIYYQVQLVKSQHLFSLLVARWSEIFHPAYLISSNLLIGIICQMLESFSSKALYDFSTYDSCLQ